MLKIVKNLKYNLENAKANAECGLGFESAKSLSKSIAWFETQVIRLDIELTDEEEQVYDQACGYLYRLDRELSHLG